MGSLTSTQKASKHKSKPSIYPCLMQSKHSKIIVLFWSEGNGVIVERGDALIRDLGDSEVTLWDMKVFQPYYGTVTLESKP